MDIEKQAVKSSDKRVLAPEALEELRITVIDLFSNGMFHEVGIREIARKAKVSPQTIYKYFGNKDELIFACIEPQLKEMLEMLQATVAANKSAGIATQIDVFCQAYVGYFLEHRAFAEIVFINIPLRKWQSDPHFVQYQHLGIMLELLQEGQQAGVIRQDVPVEELLIVLSGAAYRYMVYALSCDLGNDPAAVGERLNKLLSPLIYSQH